MTLHAIQCRPYELRADITFPNACWCMHVCVRARARACPRVRAYASIRTEIALESRSLSRGICDRLLKDPDFFSELTPPNPLFSIRCSTTLARPPAPQRTRSNTGPLLTAGSFPLSPCSGGSFPPPGAVDGDGSPADAPSRWSPDCVRFCIDEDRCSPRRVCFCLCGPSTGSDASLSPCPSPSSCAALSWLGLALPNKALADLRTDSHGRKDRVDVSSFPAAASAS